MRRNNGKKPRGAPRACNEPTRLAERKQNSLVTVLFLPCLVRPSRCHSAFDEGGDRNIRTSALPSLERPEVFACSQRQVNDDGPWLWGSKGVKGHFGSTKAHRTCSNSESYHRMYYTNPSWTSSAGCKAPGGRNEGLQFEPSV